MSSAEKSPEAEPPTATYTGSCHCSRFTYTVTQSPPLEDPSSEVIDCNCSICSRNGYLFVYVPEKSFTFEAGNQEELTKYTFEPKHRIAHYFCPSCGTSCFAQSTTEDFYPDYKAVNVRTFQDLDLKMLKLKLVDGKNT